jgi:membrane protein DedA with SNARE-associated domain
MNRTRLKYAAIAVLMLTAIILLTTFTVGRELLADRQPTLRSFALLNFAGYLFFLLMPVEALIPLYQSEGHDGAVLIIVAVTTAVASQLIDYGIGRAVSGKVLHHVIGLVGEKRYAKAERAIRQWGNWAIFVFNLFPLSSPNLLLAAGIVRHNLAATMLYSVCGLVLKYFAIVYVFEAFF